MITWLIVKILADQSVIKIIVSCSSSLTFHLRNVLSLCDRCHFESTQWAGLHGHITIFSLCWHEYIIWIFLNDQTALLGLCTSPALLFLLCSSSIHSSLKAVWLHIPPGAVVSLQSFREFPPLYGCLLDNLQGGFCEAFALDVFPADKISVGPFNSRSKKKCQPGLGSCG